MQDLRQRRMNAKPRCSTHIQPSTVDAEPKNDADRTLIPEPQKTTPHDTPSRSLARPWISKSRSGDNTDSYRRRERVATLRGCEIEVEVVRLRGLACEGVRLRVVRLRM